MSPDRLYKERMSIDPKNSPVPEPMAGVFHRFCHVNAMQGNYLNLISGYINSALNPGWAVLFKQQLAAAIKQGTVTPAEYEALTDEDFSSQDDLRARLLELWHDLYSGEQP